MSKYIFKIIKNASLDKMKEAVNTVHERSGMSKRKIFNDMLHCTSAARDLYDAPDQQKIQHLYERLRVRAFP